MAGLGLGGRLDTCVKYQDLHYELQGLHFVNAKCKPFTFVGVVTFCSLIFDHLLQVVGANKSPYLGNGAR